jgi:6-phosphogluconate dehydrogenase
MYFVGCGISGGEEGALHGASIMPGGAQEAWPVIQPMLKSIAAKAEDGTPCCEWVGPGGAGHYVKMVHNGIEYGDMQLIAETYFAMKHLLALKNEQMADIFEQWDKGRLHSYLIEITSAILRHKEEGGDYLLDNILDAAGQKGTGRWSVINSLQLNTPLDVIAEAVFARNLSAEKNLRVLMSKHYMHVENHPVYNYQDTVIGLESTLYAARLTGYAQGFALMCTASEQYGWKLNLSTIALLWRAGCIIRSAFLNDIAEAYHRAPGLSHLLLDEHFGREVMEALPAWKKYIGVMLREGLPVPVLSAALNYFLGLTTNRSPANMIQAMRDYFGAHTFERVDSPRGEFFHEHWEDNY